MPSNILLGPFKHGLAWVAYRFTSTVLDDIWPGVVFFTGIATMVVCVSEFTTTKLGINSTMLTVLGTIVSLVVSFKTNNSYSRWWEGRNIWSNLTTVANAPPPKAEDTAKPQDKSSEQRSSSRAQNGTNSPTPTQKVSSATFHTAASTSFHESHTSILSSPEKTEASAVNGDGAERNRANLDGEDYEKEMERQEDERRAKEDPEARAEMQGIIEKKTYIGLVQAFVVSMKHTLRGETGPFYSDLYSLIAFLPKYNPSAYPPVTRDHLLALWYNGLPRQRQQPGSSGGDGLVAVPLTVPVAFAPEAEVAEGGDAGPGAQSSLADKEKGARLYGPRQEEFKDQAIQSARAFVEKDDPEVLVLTNKRNGRQSVHVGEGVQLGGSSHSLGNQAGPPARAGTGGVNLETVELMPPRHPPRAKIYDFVPPLRIFKVVYDMFRIKGKDRNERVKGGKRRRMGTTMEIPQEILMYLSAYCADLTRRNLIAASYISIFAAPILELQRAISDLEKIATTPLPSAYTFHLRLTVYFYLFFIPFQVYNYLGWVTIPATAVAATVYLGFLEIGMQIEMPFYYDQSDLDLDEFVLRISKQIAQLTAFPTNISSSHVVLSHLNQPFLPSISASAPDLLGVPERGSRPTARGFTSAFTAFDPSSPPTLSNTGTGPQSKPSSSSSPSSSSENEPHDENSKKREETKPMLKSMREIELALNANWKDVTNDVSHFIGQPRDQLENRTGLEVAVLTL